MGRRARTDLLDVVVLWAYVALLAIVVAALVAGILIGRCA